MDQCAYQLSFLENREIPVPYNEADVLQSCKQSQSGIKCLRSHTEECMTGMIKNIFLNAIVTLEKHINNRCDSKPHRDEFIKHVTCFHDPAKAEAIRLCTDRYLVIMEKTSELDPAYQLGGACCSVQAMHDCAVDKFRSNCNEESGDYFEELLGEVNEGNNQTVCAQFNSIRACDSNYDSKIWSQFKSIMASNDPLIIKAHRYKSVIPPVIKMFSGA